MEKEFALETGTASTHYTLGNLYYRTKDYERAIDQYNIALQLAPGDPMVYFARGIVPSGRTIVPLRFISEMLGAKVDYNSLTREITITP